MDNESTMASHLKKRTRSLEDDCESTGKLSTLFNNNDHNKPFVGMMFEVFSKQAMELQTLELDIKLGKTDSLKVEVFAKRGSYLSATDNEAAWEKVADTNLIILPESGGAIIPSQHFQTIEMNPFDKWSIYVTMTGPYLDYTISENKQPGLKQISSPELDISNGAGLNDYKFSGMVDSANEPQFAGTIYYKKTQDCEATMAITSIQYQLLARHVRNQESTSVAAERLVDEVVDLVLAEREFGKEYGVERQGMAKAVVSKPNDDCADKEKPCFSTANVVVDVQLSHKASLDSSLVKYAFYKDAFATSDIIKNDLPALMSNTFEYIGYESKSARFEIELSGSDLLSEMDDSQLDYFNRVTTRFLESSINTNDTQVLTVQVSGQSFFKTKRKGSPTRYLSDDTEGTLRLHGTILGVQLDSTAEGSFSTVIETALENNPKAYFKMLRLDGLRPTELIDVHQLKYFNTFRDFDGQIHADEDPIDCFQIPTPTNKHAAFKGFVSGIAIAVIVIVMLGFFYWLKKKIDMKLDEMRKLAVHEEEVQKMEELKKGNLGPRQQYRYSTRSYLTVSAGSTRFLTRPGGTSSADLSASTEIMDVDLF